MIINGNPMVIPWNYPLLRPKSSWTCGSWALHFGTIRLHLPAASWKTLRLNEHDKMGWFEVGETFWNGICFTVRLDSLVGDLCFSCLILFLFFELVWLVDMIFMQKTWMLWLVNGARSEIRLGSPILGIGRLHTPIPQDTHPCCPNEGKIKRIYDGITGLRVLTNWCDRPTKNRNQLRNQHQLGGGSGTCTKPQSNWMDRWLSRVE